MLQCAAVHCAVAKQDGRGSARGVKLQAQMLRFQNDLEHSWKVNALTIQLTNSKNKSSTFQCVRRGSNVCVHLPMCESWQICIHNNEFMMGDFAWHRKCALSSGHYCSEELANNTANTNTSNWSCKLAAFCFVHQFSIDHSFPIAIQIMPADSWFHLAEKSCPPVILIPTLTQFITMGQLEVEFQYWNNVANVSETE
jgi:hypothetical protein